MIKLNAVNVENNSIECHLRLLENCPRMALYPAIMIRTIKLPGAALRIPLYGLL